MGGIRWRRERVATVALPVLVVAISVIAAWQLARSQHDRRDARVRARATQAAQVVQQRIGSYTDVLFGVRGLFEASNGVGRREFHAHLHAVGVAHRYPGVRVVGVAELTPTDDTAQFVRRVRADVRRSGLPYPRFAIKGHAALERRLVVDYVEPQRGHERAFGLDLFAEPNRRRGAERALETGRPIASAPIALVQDDSHRPGLLIFLPVHSGTLTGTVYAALRFADLMRGTEVPDEPASLRLEDIGPGAGGPLDEPARRVVTFADRQPGAQTGHGVATVTFDVLGRRWRLHYAPAGAVLSAGERAIPWIVLGGGLAVAALSIWLATISVRTERRAVALAGRMTADLRATQAELERSNQELERFASVASHDLREPLRSVTGFISLLSRRHGDELGAEARSWIGYALQGAERMNALIADLLEYSRAGRADPAGSAPPRADLQAAWDRAVANLTAAIEESGATVTADRLPVVAADQREMNQVMQNLLANALTYRGEQAPVVHASAERRNGAWAVSVRDNGIGIDPRHQERIFVLFQRLHTRDDYEGTGMGLSIVKKIVEARGGSVALESAPGEGSRFTVVLPEARA
jgi:signal transduction histidine kinase